MAIRVARTICLTSCVLDACAEGVHQLGKEPVWQGIIDKQQSMAGIGWRVFWMRQQRGVTRYNCADSLDRTNVGSFFGAVQVFVEQCRELDIAIVQTPRGFSSLGRGVSVVGSCHTGVRATAEIVGRGTKSRAQTVEHTTYRSGTVLCHFHVHGASCTHLSLHLLAGAAACQCQRVRTRPSNQPSGRWQHRQWAAGYGQQARQRLYHHDAGVQG